VPAGLIELAKDAAPRRSGISPDNRQRFGAEDEVQKKSKRQIEPLRAIYGLLRDNRLASSEANGTIPLPKRRMMRHNSRHGAF
jgi:hypothetical protein